MALAGKIRAAPPGQDPCCSCLQAGFKIASYGHIDGPPDGGTVTMDPDYTSFASPYTGSLHGILLQNDIVIQNARELYIHEVLSSNSWREYVFALDGTPQGSRLWDGHVTAFGSALVQWDGPDPPAFSNVNTLEKFTFTGPLTGQWRIFRTDAVAGDPTTLWTPITLALGQSREFVPPIISAADQIAAGRSVSGRAEFMLV